MTWDIDFGVGVALDATLCVALETNYSSVERSAKVP